jgi:cysteine synthase A
MIDSIADAAGLTPLVRIGRLARQSGCAAIVTVKCEHLNLTGSHKIRGLLGMVQAAERRGHLRPGSGQTILLATGGNLGKAAVMVSAVRGYTAVLAIPDNYSPARIEFLRACGATVVLAKHHPGANAHGELALTLANEHPDWVLINQFCDLANPLAHRATAHEILLQVADRRIDAFVAGVGSAGHIMGIAPVLKQAFPTIRIIGVQPEGCDVEGGVFSDHTLQGLAVDAIPPMLDPDIIDEWVEVSQDEAIASLRGLLAMEGFAVGPSSAAVVGAALRVARGMPATSTVVTMSYDNLGDYPELFPRLAPRDGTCVVEHAGAEVQRGAALGSNSAPPR